MTVNDTVARPTVEAVSGDAATWAVKVDGRTIAVCRNATVARETARRVAKQLQREARIAAIRALADYLEQNPDAPCTRVGASAWVEDPKEWRRARRTCQARPSTTATSTGSAWTWTSAHT